MVDWITENDVLVCPSWKSQVENEHYLAILKHALMKLSTRILFQKLAILQLSSRAEPKNNVCLLRALLSYFLSGGSSGLA